jgi:hypothetical protein
VNAPGDTGLAYERRNRIFSRMPRPLLWNVDHGHEPPVVSVLLPGVPRRFVTFTIGRRATPQETEAVAVAELRATPTEVLEAMAADAR